MGKNLLDGKSAKKLTFGIPMVSKEWSNTGCKERLLNSDRPQTGGTSDKTEKQHDETAVFATFGLQTTNTASFQTSTAIPEQIQAAARTTGNYQKVLKTQREDSAQAKKNKEYFCSNSAKKKSEPN